VALSRTGGLSVADYEKNGAVLVYDVTAERRVIELKTGRAAGTAFSPDGKFVAALGKGKVGVWEVSTGQGVFSAPFDAGLAHATRGIAFTPDGKRLITTHGTHCPVWDVAAETQGK